MHILIANNLPIPALKYGGTERVIWWLGKELARRGNKVTYLVPQGSYCNFADVLRIRIDQPIAEQIPSDVDLVHSNFPILQELPKPFLVTMHGYNPKGGTFDRNTVFVSKRHAELHHAEAFVYNGLDPEEYGQFDPDAKRVHILFLAAITRVEKNLLGAISIAKKAKRNLAIIGGNKFSLSRRIRYYGLIGGEEKNELLRTSSALLFPVTWDEPFGLAVIESLYHGAPVIATPFGALQEIVSEDVGVLTGSMHELVEAAKDHSRFDRQRCHDYVMSRFTSVQMTDSYLALYDNLLSGQSLNKSDPYFKSESFTEKYPLFP
ncbi:MAG: glycosyltransferase [bacterium]